MLLRRVALALAALLVVAAGVHLLAPAGAPPLYDGIGFPDEPYRFVNPPAGYQATKPPTSARATFTAAPSGPGQDQFVSSAESGPQVSLFLAAHSLTAPQGDAVVSAVPIPPPKIPVTGYAWGNVYRVDFGPATLRSGSPDQIQMRAPTPQQPGPTFEVLRNGTWQHLPTNRTGNDIYATSLTGPGDYLLVGGQKLNLAASDPNDESNISIVGVVISVVAVVLVIMLFVRVERRRSRQRRERREAAAVGEG